MEELIRVDFGNSGVECDAGFCKKDRIYSDSRIMIVTETWNKRVGEGEPSPYKDILFRATGGEIRMGLCPGKYRFVFHFYNPEDDYAPFRLNLCATDPYAPVHSGTVLAGGLVPVQKGKKVTVEHTIGFAGGTLAVSLPDAYYISGMDVYSEGGALVPVYPEAPVLSLPGSEALAAMPCDTPADMLRRICDFLMANRDEAGFIGDFDYRKKLWYTASYPIRVLLCGSSLLLNSDYREAALRLLDIMVSEQMPEGSFTQAFRNQKTENLSDTELAEVRGHFWMNLADVGSAVAALAFALPFTEADRRARYTSSLIRYTENWMLRYREPCGGFRNGWVYKESTHIYSVSTAASALTLLLLSRETGHDRYAMYATQAVRYLVAGWQESGPFVNHIFDGTYPGHDHYQNTNEFGDGFYVMEALCAYLALGESEALRRTVFSCLEAYLFGCDGILAHKKGQTYWPLRDIWNNSKSAGNLLLLDTYLQYAPAFQADAEKVKTAEKEAEGCRRFLCTPQTARLLGVCLGLPEDRYPFPQNSIMGWGGCTVAATAFGGLAIANTLQNGSAFRIDKKDSRLF